MYSFFSDLHVETLARGILEPNEQVLGTTVAEHNPWWSMGLIRRTYLMIATDQRLVMVAHHFNWLHTSMRLAAIESYGWQAVEQMQLKGIFSKKIALKATGNQGPVKHTLKVPNTFFGLLAPMRNNLAGARTITERFSQGGLAAPSALPAYNAMGYSSVPPLAPPQVVPQLAAYPEQYR
jgi:hypothetical protein